ncbi:hypothetical protein TBLA_0D01010 [Henningerozyma blattae CBS 6284]|uniref:Thioredoxin domain-containing protein n=1 Tax=Henningerozyma blattae (strain ATCC 34711 / CBS 6284 / DSM 70876 / NBRC 10599 / NRRL Y-10934 / UCD 77-7) TaxID=1071380 RepID=I2H2K7_HENB6|nr:hypothetical protein TBLA_0D01010 [Tetrapisispora blattae CBS 6284]CCH60609.1 hypothetical protein TBLA_0D01010 [Tetrapisispora blattae CBS 6284]
MKKFNLIFTISWALFNSLLIYGQNFYDSNPNIIELNSRTFDRVIHHTNYTTLVEFYAPWCGYCQKLKPILEKTAKQLNGIVQIAAINCDLDMNKQLCGQESIEGFPTLKVFRPPKINFNVKPEDRVDFKTHASEVYIGERKVSPMIDFMISRIKSYVKRVQNIKNLRNLICKKDKEQELKVVYFSKNEKVSSVFKTLAIDFLGKVKFYHITNGVFKGFENDEVEINKSMKTYPNITKFLLELEKDQKDKNNSKNNRLVFFKAQEDKYLEYSGENFNKIDIESFIMKEFNITPTEGPLSKKVSI